MNQNSIKVAYARVSSIDDRQKLGLEVQEKALEGCDYLFKEKHSGSDNNRPQLAKSINKAKSLVQSGYKVSFCVYKMDRLSRKTSTLLKIIEELKDYGIEFVSVKENIDTSTPTGILMYQLLGIFAEFELNNLKQRTREGLAQAKANGVKLGNKGLDNSVEQKIIRLYQNIDIPVRVVAKHCKVSEATVYNVAKRNNLSRKNQKFSSHSTKKMV